MYEVVETYSGTAFERVIPASRPSAIKKIGRLGSEAQCSGAVECTIVKKEYDRILPNPEPI